MALPFLDLNKFMFVKNSFPISHSVPARSQYEENIEFISEAYERSK